MSTQRDHPRAVFLYAGVSHRTDAPFVVDVPDIFTQAFVIEKDSKRFPQSGGWGYALFNYEAASDNFTADPSPSDCGHACHVTVKAKDHIFHPYQKR